MNGYLKNFLRRGLVFGGLGPIVVGIIFLCLGFSIPDFSIDGTEVFVAVLSTYLLAFVVAGASVFHQIDSFSTMKSTACHLSIVYLAYIVTYLINSWIPFEPLVIFIFTAVFLATYFVISLTVYLTLKILERKINSKIKEHE